jgi:RNA polymerase sigma factor (sigma-70 family)
MDEEAINSRLSRISTIWTMLGNAHRGPDSIAVGAQYALIQRYQGAVYRYLLGALRDPDAADDLFQDFALRIMQGAFRRVDPQRGRFRDYLKSTLIHLVADYQNRRRIRAVPMDNSFNEPAVAADNPAADEDRFLQSWKEELLAKAWESLQRAEQEGGQPYYSALRFRAEHSGATSADMARRLTEQLRPEHAFTDTGIRKTLERAKKQFADLLLDEIAASLEDPTPEQLEQELIELELMPHCRSALKRRIDHGG